MNMDRAAKRRGPPALLLIKAPGHRTARKKLRRSSFNGDCYRDGARSLPLSHPPCARGGLQGTRSSLIWRWQRAEALHADYHVNGNAEATFSRATLGGINARLPPETMREPFQ